MTMITALQNQDAEGVQQDLEHVVSHILEEGRMILPGIQALLGFQLVAVFNQKFSEMPAVDQYIHVAAICLSVNAICFLLSPAALHRQSNPGFLTTAFAKSASRFTCMGMFPLLASIVLDCYVVIHKVTGNLAISISLATLLFAELLYCWVIYPRLKRQPRVGHGVINRC